MALCPEDRDRLIRIDERTAIMAKLFDRHMEQDRQDFDALHHRVNRLSAKQNWMIGVATTLGGVMGIVGIWKRDTFTAGV